MVVLFSFRHHSLPSWHKRTAYSIWVRRNPENVTPGRLPRQVRHHLRLTLFIRFYFTFKECDIDPHFLVQGWGISDPRGLKVAI